MPLLNISQRGENKNPTFQSFLSYSLRNSNGGDRANEVRNAWVIRFY